MAISTTQRSSFGRRYTGGSPFGAERNRLVNEYGLAPNRGAMGMQASQNAQALAQNQAQYERSFAQQQGNFDKQMALAGQGQDYSKLPGPGGYLARYPEVSESIYYAKDPYAHYLANKDKGYTWVGDPTPEWSDAEKDAFYLYMYPDVRNAGMTGKHHYELFGKNEGRFWPTRAA
jgi:hypothetical protein